MSWLFGRKKGRHVRGAAGTAVSAAQMSYAPVVAPAVRPLAAPAPVSYAPVPVILPPAAPLPAPAPDRPTGPRGELTFADGSSAALDPEQARALDEIAQLLTRRD